MSDKRTHECEEWQMQDSARGDRYCAACGESESHVKHHDGNLYNFHPVNYGKHQLAWRKIDDEEPLRLMEIGPIGIWLDENNEVALLDVPPGYETTTVH